MKDSFGLYDYAFHLPTIWIDPLGLTSKSHPFKEGTINFSSTTPKTINVAQYGFEVTIEFIPEPAKCSCEKIVWIQWIYQAGVGSLDNPFTGGKIHPYYNYNPTENVHTGTGGAEAKPSGTYSDAYGQTGGVTTDGSQTKAIPAILKDSPKIRSNTAWQSCAQCFDNKKWLGCVLWQYYHNDKMTNPRHEIQIMGFFNEPIAPAPLDGKWKP